MVFRKALEPDPRAVGQFLLTPLQGSYAAVRTLAAGIIHLAVVLQRNLRLGVHHQPLLAKPLVISLLQGLDSPLLDFPFQSEAQQLSRIKLGRNACNPLVRL